MKPAPLLQPAPPVDGDETPSLSSGILYRGRLIAALRGQAVFTDPARARLLHFPGDLIPSESLQARSAVVGVQGAADGDERTGLTLSEDADGELYLLTQSDGWIRRLTAP